MEKTNKNKQLKEKEGQVICFSCQSRKIQLAYLKQTGDQTVITCLCFVCGNLFPLQFTGEVSVNEEINIVAPKEAPTYTG